MPANNTELEKKLWDAADVLRANSKLKSSEYSMPVLGLVFLKWADFKFAHAQRELEEETKNRIVGHTIDAEHKLERIATKRYVTPQDHLYHLEPAYG